MELTYLDRRRSTTTTAGTGDLTLTAPSGPWTAIDEADFGAEFFTYTIAGVLEWETGRGHLDTGNVLVRDQVFANSNGDTNPVDFSGEPKDVLVTFLSRVADGVAELNKFGVSIPGRVRTDTTTDATPTEITPRLNTEYSTATCVVELYVLAQTADFKTKSWRITYMIVNDGMTSTTYGKVVDDIAQSESLTWDVDASTDGTHIVTVTGAAATTIDWYVYGSIKALVPLE